MHDIEEHKPANFHTTYQGFNGVLNLDGELCWGEMPKKQMKYITAWADIHKDELLANWTLAIEEQPLYKIDPLRET